MRQLHSKWNAVFGVMSKSYSSHNILSQKMFRSSATLNSRLNQEKYTTSAFLTRFCGHGFNVASTTTQASTSRKARSLTFLKGLEPGADLTADELMVLTN